MAITAITSVQEFDEKVLGSKGLAIVDFWAAWCEPCTVMRPEVEAVAERFEGQVEFFSVDAEDKKSSWYFIERRHRWHSIHGILP